MTPEKTIWTVGEILNDKKLKDIWDDKFVPVEKVKELRKEIRGYLAISDCEEYEKDELMKIIDKIFGDEK